VWSAPRPGRFTPGKDPVPIVQEAGCKELIAKYGYSIYIYIYIYIYVYI
jgi:hypothetical protein